MPVQRPYNPNAKRMAEMIQADWAKVGVQTKIVTYEWGEYLKRVKGGEHQAALMGWTTATGDPDNFFGPLFTCTSANGGSNSAKWCYKPFDDIIAEAKSITDHDKRVALYKQAQQMMHDQMPAVMIAHSTILNRFVRKSRGTKSTRLANISSGRLISNHDFSLPVAWRRLSQIVLPASFLSQQTRLTFAITSNAYLQITWKTIMRTHTF